MRTYWLKEASRLERRIAIAWQFSLFLPIATTVAGISVPMTILFRQGGGTSRTMLIVLLLALGLSWVAIVVCARDRKISRLSALAIIDERLKLKLKLVTAMENNGNWPPPQSIPSIFSLQRSQFLLPGAIILIWWISAVVPVSSIEFEVAHPIKKQLPKEVREIQEKVEKISHLGVSDRYQLSEVRRALDEISQLSLEELYSLSTLETADALKIRTNALVDDTRNSVKGELEKLTNQVSKTEAREIERSHLENVQAALSTLTAQVSIEGPINVQSVGNKDHGSPGGGNTEESNVELHQQDQRSPLANRRIEILPDESLNPPNVVRLVPAISRPGVDRTHPLTREQPPQAQGKLASLHNRIFSPEESRFLDRYFEALR